MKSLRIPTVLASLSFLGVAACTGTDVASPPLSPTAVRARLATLVPPIVARSADAVTAAHSPLVVLGKLTDLAASADPTGSARPPSLTAIPRLTQIVQFIGFGGMHNVDRGAVTDLPTDEPPTTPPWTRYPAAVIAADFTDAVFTDANFRDGAFQVPTTVWCGGDAGCAARLEGEHYQIIATASGVDGLDLELVKGLEREAVATISLDPRNVHASVDLSGLGPVMTAVFDRSGDATHDLTVEASGVIDADLSVLGREDATAGLTIEEPIHVVIHRASTPSPGAAFSLDVAAAAPALVIHLDGPHHEVVSGFTFGAVRVQFPADGKTPAKIIDVPALEMASTARTGQALEIQGLSLGDRSTQIIVGDKVVGTVDLNPHNGRSVDLSIEEEADTGAMIVEAVPSLELVASDAAAVEWPARMQLDPANGTNGAVRVSADAVDVIGGTLTLIGKAGDRAVVINAGQCVASSTGNARGSILALRAVECPVREAM